MGEIMFDKNVFLKCLALKEEILEKYRPFNTHKLNFYDFESRRFNEYAEKVALCYKENGKIIDIGAGTNAINLLFRTLGMEVHIADDFLDSGYRDIDKASVLSMLGNCGIHIHILDITKENLSLPDNYFDVVTSNDFFEHIYRNALGVMREIYRILKPKGRVLIATPNAANLKKRFEVLLGRNIWHPLEEWFSEEDFRGHVREPILQDLEKMINTVGFKTEHKIGANWIVQLPRPVDDILRFFPSLCANIAVIGVKPADSPQA